MRRILLFGVTIALLTVSMEIRGQEAKSDAKDVNKKGTVWYHPNSWWRVKGKKVTVKEGAFTYRSFAPQYGYPMSFDKGWHRGFDKVWKAWKAENDFVCPYVIQGHTRWPKEWRQKYPEYMAMYKGKRSGSSKLCISNPGLRKLYREHILTMVDSLKDKRTLISVEPTDGFGHCECKKCQEMGTVSERVFTLCNDAAKYVKSKYPKAMLSVNAYAAHASPPSFNLEPNVFMLVIPKGFQDIYDPYVLFYDWEKKATVRAWYDYLGLPQFTGEQPRIYADKAIQMSNMGRSMGYIGTHNEVGLHLPATLSLHLLGQMWKDPNRSFDEALNQMVSDCFPSANKPMKRLFTRWFYTWFGKREISASLFDIKETSMMINTPNERERLLDCMAYVHYFALLQDAYDTGNSKKSLSNLFQYIYDVANRQVVNVTALTAMWSDKLKGKGLDDPYKWTALTQHDAKKRDYSFIKPITKKRIYENFKKDCAKYGVEKLIYKRTPIKEIICAVKKAEIPYQKSLNIGSNPWMRSHYLWIKKGELKITINQASVNVKDTLHVLNKNERFPLLQFIEQDTKKVLDRELIKKIGQIITFPVPKTGLYRLALHRTSYAKMTLQGDFYMFKSRMDVLKRLKKLTQKVDFSWRSYNDGKLSEETKGTKEQLMKLNSDWLLFVKQVGADYNI